MTPNVLVSLLQDKKDSSVIDKDSHGDELHFLWSLANASMVR